MGLLGRRRKMTIGIAIESVILGYRQLTIPWQSGQILPICFPVIALHREPNDGQTCRIQAGMEQNAIRNVLRFTVKRSE